MRTEVLAATSIGASVLPMLLFIVIHGGLRMMMGQHARSESLFYYFRNEKTLAPANRDKVAQVFLNRRVGSFESRLGSHSSSSRTLSSHMN
jgi:hypothetical protein